MKKITIYLVLLSVSFLVSCMSNTSQNSLADLTSSIRKQKICMMQENLDVLGVIDDACFVNDTTMLILTGGKLFFYSLDGKQIGIWNKKGEAPDEYIHPGLIQSDGKYIYIWCDATLRLLKYDLNAKLQYYFDYHKNAIKDFLIYKDKYAIFYNTGGQLDPVITVYDLQTGEICAKEGVFSEEDLVLALWKNKGNMVLKDSILFYTTFSGQNIFALDMETLLPIKQNTILKDKEFKIEHIDDASELINIHRNQAFTYMCNNSLHDGLFLTHEGLLSKAEIGIYNKHGNKLDKSERVTRFYLMKKDSVVTYSELVPQGLNSMNYVGNGQDLFCIENIINNDDCFFILYHVLLF